MLTYADVCTLVPQLAAQQAVNQPAGSMPEVLAKRELISEPKGALRYGKMSADAAAVAAAGERTRRATAMHLYSPAAGYRALPPATNLAKRYYYFALVLLVMIVLGCH